ncbi:hypothetical protein Rs2_40638 [Raphanus sativus]|nr:hypothetical protein Rs2_40638 [Raphanus sativus]
MALHCDARLSYLGGKALFSVIQRSTAHSGMAHRYSRSEKGKWVPEASKSMDRKSSTQGRRAPVLLPASDNSDLIEDNKLTLLGRVTKPTVQKPQWVLDWLIQFWNLETAVTGRTLGPDLFQVKFETEEAILSIGPRIDEDVPQGRVRIDVECLRSLEIHLPVQLQSGEAFTVDLEYENLQKQCFYCYSLFHEVDDCPTKPASERNSTHSLGISQQNTLRSIEDHRRIQDHRRTSSNQTRHSGAYQREDLPRSQ